MAEIERLEVVIDLIDSFSTELNQLIADLGELKTAIEAVDGSRVKIDVDLQDDEQALAQLAALRSAGALGGGGDINIAGGGGGGAPVAMRTMTQQMERLIDTFETDISKKMENTADAMESVSESGGILDLRMTDLHNALAKAVPLIIVLIGAMPAVIGGLVTLATAAFAAAASLFAITGLGALAVSEMRGGGDFGEGFMEILRDLREAFLDAFMPLARQLLPVFQDFTDGLEKFFQALANRGDVLTDLVDDARAFGGFLLDVVPDTIASLGRMADAFSGIFGRIAGVIRNADIIEGMVRFMEEAGPALINFARQIAGMIEPILVLSVGFLQVTNIILTVIGAILDFMAALERLGIPIGFLIASGLALITTYFILSTVIGGLSAVVGAATSGFFLFGAALTVADVAAKAMAAATALLSASMWQLAAAVTVATAGLALLIALGTAAVKKFTSVGDRISQATEELRKFNEVGQQFGDNPFAEPELSGRGVAGAAGGRPVDVTVQGATSKENTADAVWRMKQTNK